MNTHITQKGELRISTDEQTEGYALLKWMESNRQIKGIMIELLDGGYTRLVIPSQTPTITSPIKETAKKAAPVKTVGTR